MPVRGSPCSRRIAASDPEVDVRLLGPRSRLRRCPQGKRPSRPQRAPARDDRRPPELRRWRALELHGLGDDQGWRMAEGQRPQVRLHHVVPQGQDVGHLLHLRTVALPLRRSYARSEDPGQRPDAAPVPVAGAEHAGPDTDASPDAHAHAASDAHAHAAPDARAHATPDAHPDPDADPDPDPDAHAGLNPVSVPDRFGPLGSVRSPGHTQPALGRPGGSAPPWRRPELHEGSDCQWPPWSSTPTAPPLMRVRPPSNCWA